MLKTAIFLPSGEIWHRDRNSGRAWSIVVVCLRPVTTQWIDSFCFLLFVCGFMFYLLLLDAAAVAAYVATSSFLFTNPIFHLLHFTVSLFSFSPSLYVTELLSILLLFLFHVILCLYFYLSIFFFSFFICCTPFFILILTDNKTICRVRFVLYLCINNNKYEKKKKK